MTPTPLPDLAATVLLAREAKARAEKATPGPMRLITSLGGECWDLISLAGADTDPDGAGQHVASIYDGNKIQAGPDGVFYSLARTDVPTLAAAVLAFDVENRRLREALQDFVSWSEIDGSPDLQRLADNGRAALNPEKP